MPDPRVESLERAAARHWQAPDTEPLGEWRLRAAAGFTGRANSALPLGDPGCPVPAAVTAVEQWYRRRDLRPMIVLPRGTGPDQLENHLNERRWLPRSGPAFVMLADIAALPASPADVEFAPEPDEAFLRLYRYRGQELPPIARTLLMSAPWQAFGRIRRDGRPPGRTSDPAPGRDDQRPGPRALLPVRLHRLAPLPLHDGPVRRHAPASHPPTGTGFSLPWCNGDPCPERIHPLARRAG
jgi:hypothetical protein